MSKVGGNTIPQPWIWREKKSTIILLKAHNKHHLRHIKCMPDVLSAVVPSVVVLLTVVALITRCILRLSKDDIGTIQKALSLLKRPNA